MTVFVPESIHILGTDGGGLSVVLCSMYVDTLADLPAPTAYTGYRLSMGCTARVISDNSRHRINSAGQWVQIAAGTASYTRAEIDAIVQQINAENAEQQAEINYLANTGAKNILKITERSKVHIGVTFTVNADESVSISGGTTGSNSFMRLTGIQTSTAYSEQITLPKGRYKISCPGALSTDNFRFVVGYRNTSTDARSTVTAQSSNGFEGDFEITTDTGRFDATVLSVSTDPNYSATVYPMIRRAEIKDDTFVPYAPTNRQLYELINQYHP